MRLKEEQELVISTIMRVFYWEAQEICIICKISILFLWLLSSWKLLCCGHFDLHNQADSFTHLRGALTSMKQKVSEPGQDIPSSRGAKHYGGLVILHLYSLTSSEVHVDGGWAVWINITIGNISIRHSHPDIVYHKEETPIIVVSLPDSRQPESTKNTGQISAKDQKSRNNQLQKSFLLNVSIMRQFENRQDLSIRNISSQLCS